VDPNTGWLTTQGELDYETEEEYEIEIVAADNGGIGKMTGSAVVRVNVADANDR
jgi:hypothetical protein